MNTYFISGIGTEVGKTLISAIVVEALQADYWKPIQAGDLQNSDTHKVKNLVSNSTSHFFENAYALQTPMSPHAAAEIDNIRIDLANIKRPKINNNLVIEGAGGLLVPLNDEDCIIDLMQAEDKIILVSRHYLGSINHTLLSIEALQQRGFIQIGIIFSGDEHPTTESIILQKTNAKFLGRIPELKTINKERVATEAAKLRNSLMEF
ncbi:dethiobiotin synthase [Psychroflexus planctonicus]|uniref:ATP-dependent dethiobiotin synthetase BioD n=1 Tax=Psychroflexus planctonicus TaxID=1526575 RepID=A0ABQ1SDX7_9FLAO|nr:dethiobiotin synthase [Psychroflexus planctonicus]GGE25680.1 ATP-dependent dethiobiotin synthetase BioD [Psychroflexus planctonicus]